MPITHSKVSLLSNNGDPNLVQPTDWNASHNISGVLDLSGTTGLILGGGGIVGGLIPNTTLAFSATPVFDVSKNASYSMTLTGNVTSSSLSGAPSNGQLLSLTLTEDAIGGRAFNFPANFIFTPTFSFNNTALAINELTFKFDGTNWHLVSNVGGAGGGANPLGNNGDLQFKNGSNLGASTVNDNGVRVALGLDAQFRGVNPWTDIRAFGARATTIGVTPTTNCSIAATSTAMTLSAASTFQNGDGIVCREAGPTIGIAAPGAPTVVAMNSKHLTGTGVFSPNGTGTTSYSYCVVAITAGGGYTACSATTTITNGSATLGQLNSTVASWSRSNTTVTVTTSANHNLVAGTWFEIRNSGGIDGWFQTVTATPGTTSFTFTSGNDTRNSATTSGSGGTVVYYVGNHITWPTVTNAWKYAVYDTVRNACVGISLPQNINFSGVDPLFNEVDDFGSIVSTCPNQPAWFPTTPPVAAKNEDLVTTIVSGAGTTSLVVANAASNTVSNKVAIIDNTPNIIAAANAAFGGSAVRGVVYIPSGTNVQFVTSSVLDLSAFGAVAFAQSGTLALGDTMRLTLTSWKGFPDTPTTGGGSFSLGTHPNITSVTASPMVYVNNKTTHFENVAFTGQSANSQVLFLIDFGNIPGNSFRNVGFFTGGSADWNSQHLILRNNGSGGALFTFNRVNFVSGPNISDNAWTPLFYNTQGGSPFVFNDIMMSRRGLAFGGPAPQTSFNNIYCQGCTTPKINFFTSSGSSVLVNADILGSVEDTSTKATFSYTSNVFGTLRSFANNALTTVNGPGNVSIKTGSANAGVGQNTATESEVLQQLALDGILSVSAVNYPQKFLNASLAIGSIYKSYVASVAQAAPTCAVSAGGTVNFSGTFTVIPVFPDGSEGTPSAPSNTCTTSGGNQTITINWAIVPGAIGYDLYGGGISFQCAPPWVSPGSATSYVWTGISRCGQSQPPIGAGGPQSIGPQGIHATLLRIAATDGTGVAGITASKLTGNLTDTLPSIGGTLLTDNYLLSGVVTQYDNFNRANGGLGANWTTFPGNSPPAIVSNQLVGTIAATGQSAFYTGATFGSDQFSQITAGAVGNVLAVIQLYVRSSITGGNTNAVFFQCSNSTTQWIKVVNGVTTFFGSPGVNCSYTTGDVFRVEAIGNTYTLFKNGVSILSSTDTTPPFLSSGSPGVGTFGNNAAMVLDNWSGGSSGNVPSADKENDWLQPQHFLSPVTIGNSTIPAGGGPLAANTLYSQNLILGAPGSLTNSLSSVSGNSGRLGQTSGTLTNAHLVSFDASGNLIDSGISSSAISAPLSSITAATTANSINNADNAQTWNWALTTPAKTAFSFTENVASTGGVGSQFIGTFGTLASSTAVPLKIFNTLTGSQTLPALLIAPTWNTTGVVDAALLLNVSNAASGTGSLLLDAQIGSVSQWKVDKVGNSAQLGTMTLGASSPSCTPGTAGGACFNEGTAPSSGTTFDVIYGDGTQQAVSVNNHNTGNMPISRVVCVNVAPVTVSANVTTDQNLMSCTLNANLLNVVGRTLRIWSSALYATPVASVATINTKVKLCTVSGCGSGSVLTLLSYTSSANPGAVSNNSINTQNFVVTQTAGAASAYEAHGNMVIDLGASPGVADSTFSDVNTTTVSPIDSTVQLFLQLTGAFNVASASNSITQRQLVVEVIN